MKTFNTKLILPLFITLILTGCMPDSLTKFKKDPPKKAASTTTEVPVVPPTTVPDGAGGEIPLESIINPTVFTYPSSNVLIFEKGINANFGITGDNSFTVKETRESLINKCTISPALPGGITISNKTCAIQGVAAEVFTDSTTFLTADKGKKAFTITVTYINSAGALATLTRAIKLQVLAKPVKLRYSQSSRVILKVAPSDLSTFDSNNGDIVTDDRKGPSDTTKKTIVGQVRTIDLTNNLIGIVNLKNLDYQRNVTNFTDTNNDYQPDVDPANPKYYLEPGDDIDSDNTYYSKKATISEIKNIFPTFAIAPIPINVPTLQPLNIDGSGVNVNDVTSARNYLEFTVSPKLPAGFTLDQMTGRVTGYSATAIPMTTYLITASNILGSTTFPLQFEVVDAPSRLSITRKQLIKVSALTYSFLREGDSIVTPIISLKPSVHGIITKMIPATNQLEIQSLDGSFAKNDQIDMGKTFNSLLGTVLTDPLNFDAAITVAAPISIAAGGEGVGDLYALNNTASPIVSDRIYVSATDATPILVGDAFKTTTISEIDSESLKVTLTVNPSPTKYIGLDILSSTARARGYVYAHVGADVYVSDLSRSVNITDTGSTGLRVGDSLKFTERVALAGPSGTVAAIAYDHYFAAERGIYSEFRSNLVAGTGITYSVAPALPLGITLNPLTGLISGTPTIRTPVANYVITAKNLLSESTVNLKFEVRDYFSLTETSGAPSFKLHKVGDYQNSTPCKVNGSDIVNATGQRDIRCFMDGEEQDIHSFGMKLKATVGAGICQFVAIQPYSFWKWAPKKTVGTVVRWTNAGTTAASERDITSALDCDGNYTLQGGPNCDEGSITVNTYKYDSAATPTETFSNSTVISCGGKVSNCLDGGVKDILSASDIANGLRGTITASDNGFSAAPWSFSAPISKGDLTNIRIANNLYTDALAGGTKCDASAASVSDNIDLSYDHYGYLQLILDTTGTFYTVGTDTDYYSSSKDTIGGIRRGYFQAINNMRSVKPYKKVKVYSYMNPFDSAFPYYEVSCLDAAKEVKAVATIIVRDWNLNFKLNHEIDKEVPDDALAGAALARLMRATGGTITNPTNAYADWNDNYSEYTADPYNRAANTPDYASCATPPTYTIPPTKADVLTTPFPAPTEFQFPELSL